jgi:hypothetical protein
MADWRPGGTGGFLTTGMNLACHVLIVNAANRLFVSQQVADGRRSGRWFGWAI